MKDRNIELHHRVSELSTGATLVAEKVNSTRSTIGNIGRFSTLLLGKIQESPQTAADSERVLGAVQLQCM